jgi:hypothetical protein
MQIVVEQVKEALPSIHKYHFPDTEQGRCSGPYNLGYLTETVRKVRKEPLLDVMER